MINVTGNNRFNPQPLLSKSFILNFDNWHLKPVDQHETLHKKYGVQPL